MRKGTWKTCAGWILLSEAVGALSAWISREGLRVFQETAVQPPLTPPAVVFPIVWGILYALMGIGAARISLTPASAARSKGLRLFIAQLIVNFLWSPVFFGAQAYGLAFFWLLLLWVLVAAMILRFQETDLLAAKLQIPYLLWLSFAAGLNLWVWKLNP